MIKPTELFCSSRLGYKVKVGTLYKDEDNHWVIEKNAPHFMKIVGGYGIQRIVEDKGKNKIDIKKLINRYPGMTLVFPLEKLGISYISKGSDWQLHSSHGNYGDGDQLFLSLKYMKTKKYDKENLQS